MRMLALETRLPLAFLLRGRSASYASMGENGGKNGLNQRWPSLGLFDI